MNAEKKIDPLTGQEFTPKRSSQIFASSSNRIKYNNLKAKRFRDSLAPILNPLVKNYKILSELLKDKNEAEYHIEYLKGAGYNFDVMTHWEKIKNSETPHIFIFSLTPLKNEIIKIDKHDSNI